MGFAVPLESWLKGSLKEEVFVTLEDSESYIKNELTYNTFSLFDNLERGQKSFKNRIWKLYVLEKSIQKYKNL